MNLEYRDLEDLRRHHPAWRLLRSDHAPLIASFLHRAFVVPNRRVVPESELAETLEDDLFALRERLGPSAFPKRAAEYLDDWAQPDRSWLRKFYKEDSDEPQFDLMPSTEKAIAWLGTLGQRKFVGTESRLVTLLELLRQISTGAETDPAERLQELQRRKREIERKIEQVKQGQVLVLDDTALKDRFQQFAQMSRELLADFREVEQNFRSLDRTIRERIALWEGSKKELLDEIFGKRDAIADSDQGRSFHAFWEFLMARDRLGEFTSLLERAVSLPAVREMEPDERTRHVHYDWMDAGGHTQRTVAQLSHQLRRFLDDRAQLENRRIMELLRGIEKKALKLRESPPGGSIASVAGTKAEIRLPMERQMYRERVKHPIEDTELSHGDEDLDASVLYSQVVVDKSALSEHVLQALQERSQVTLRELCESWPLQHGLAELLGYLQLATDSLRADIDTEQAEFALFTADIDPEKTESVAWQADDGAGATVTRVAEVPRVIFVERA